MMTSAVVRKWLIPVTFIGLYWIGIYLAIQSGSFSTMRVALRGGVTSADAGLFLVFALNLFPVVLMLYGALHVAKERIFPPSRFASGGRVQFGRISAYVLAGVIAICAVGLAYLPVGWFVGVRADLALLAPIPR